MKPVHRVALVAGGYLICALLASAAVALHMAATRFDAQAAGGMYAFGDSLLFVLVFGFSSLIPTAAGLYFMRPFPAFWRAISGLCAVLAVVSLLSGAIFAFSHAGNQTLLEKLSGISVLWILITPILAMASLVCAAFAPSRIPRMAFVAATVVDAGVAILGGAIFFLHMP